MYKSWFVEFTENKQARHGIVTARAKCENENDVREHYRKHHPDAQIRRIVEFENLPVVQKAQTQLDKRAQVKTRCPRCQKHVVVEKGRFAQHTNKRRATCENSGSWAKGENRRRLSRRKA